jgi:hypothetical protein
MPSALTRETPLATTTGALRTKLWAIQSKQSETRRRLKNLDIAKLALETLLRETHPPRTGEDHSKICT